MSDKKKNNDSYKEEKNILEYVVFYLSLFLVVGLLGYLTYSAITEEASEPYLTVHYLLKPQENSPYLYELVIENNGTTTAEDVLIEMIQKNKEIELERSFLKVMFVSGNSKAKGWVNFTKDPADADSIFARIVSYKSS